MPSSNYEEFTLQFTDENGVITAVPTTDVIIYDVTGAVDLTTVTTDSNGVIAAGSVALAAGSRIRFRVENYLGLAGSVTQITT